MVILIGLSDDCPNTIPTPQATLDNAMTSLWSRRRLMAAGTVWWGMVGGISWTGSGVQPLCANEGLAGMDG